MKNILWIFTRDMKRIGTNFFAVVVMIGVCFVPALYAWFNIAANMDPYSNTQGIKIAVANCDVGAESEETGELDAGGAIIDSLEENDDLGWTFVDEDEAVDGVKSGEYYAALIIPENFSEDLISVISGDIETPKIQYYVNEKKNAIAPKVTDTGATTIQQQINTTFVEVATEAVTGVLEDAAGAATDDMAEINSNVLDEIDESLEDLTKASEKLGVHQKSAKETADALASTRATIESTQAAVKSTSETLKKIEDELADKIAANLDGMDSTFDKMRELTDETESAMNTSSDVIEESCDLIAKLSDRLTEAREDVAALRSASIYQTLLDAADGSLVDKDNLADFISSPVTVTTKTLYPVKNYGTGMTPFYTNLALWVSGIVLIAILKMEVDPDERLRNMTPTQAYFGRWLTYMFFAFIQALIICAGDVWLLKVQCENLGAFFFAGICASFVFVNLIYALSITFKHTGKAICVILVILQIPSCTGTYPIEMTPGFFQAMMPLLPFTYGINAMREALIGMYANNYWVLLGQLALFLPIAFIIGLGIRPLMLNLNRMFDRKLEETGLMLCEENGMTRERLSLMAALEILEGEDEFRQKMIEKADKFEENYKKLKAAGVFLIVFLPLIFLALMFSVSSKMVFLILWIASIVAVVLYLIILEFVHDNLERKIRYSGKSAGEIISSMRGGAGNGK